MYYSLMYINSSGSVRILEQTTLNVADVKLPPNWILANSQRVATTVVLAEVEPIVDDVYNAAPWHPVIATSNNSTFAFFI